MADDIVFTKIQGSASTFTLLGSPTTPAGPVSGAAWQSVSINSETPWVSVRYPGFSGADQKYMGGRPHAFQVSGLLFADTEANLFTEVDLLLSKNKGQNVWDISGPIFSASGGAVILAINTGPHGISTALTWPFVLDLQNLGVD